MAQHLLRTSDGQRIHETVRSGDVMVSGPSLRSTAVNRVTRDRGALLRDGSFRLS